MKLRPRTMLLASLLLGASLAAACGQPATAPAASVAASATVTPQIAGQPIASTANTPRASLPVAEFERSDGTLARLPIEVPPPTEYNIGLSGRRTLGDERGMLFYYREMGR